MLVLQTFGLTSANKVITFSYIYAIRKLSPYSNLTQFLLLMCFPSSSSEIPQYRLPYHVVSFEIDMVKDLGVHVETGRVLSTYDLSVEVRCVLPSIFSVLMI